MMRSVGQRQTTEELAVRSILRTLGIRFRCNDSALPGSPDFVLPRFRTAVFVHGCFWHGHDCKRGARAPKDNAAYWQAKIARNRTRDRAVLRQLTAQGWRALVIWECHTKDAAALAQRLRRFLAR